MTPLRLLSHLLLALAALLAGGGAWAQDVSFSATATPQKIGLKDALQLTYTLENVADLQSLEPAPSKDFDVVGGPMDGHSSSTSIVNGKRSQTSSFSRTYILQAKRTGSLRAPGGVARTAGGMVYRSNAPVVEVVKGSVAPAQRQRPAQDPFFSDPAFQSPFGAPPPPPEPPTKKVWNPEPGRDLFVRASVSKPEAYVGEAVVVSYRLYSRVTVQAALSNVPQAAGAWTEEIPIGTPSPTDETVNGQPYRAVVIKQVLIYPQQAGILTLPPAEAEGYVQPPGDAYTAASSFFGAPAVGTVPVQLRTGAVSLKVLPLPEAGRPAQFEGAIGALSLHAAVDKPSTSTYAGVAFTLTLRGAGAGRLTPLPRPVFPAGIDAYEPIVHDSVLADGTGVKTARYVLAVRDAGEYTISAVSFAYFDPQSATYRTASTQPLTFRVEGASGAKWVAAIDKKSAPNKVGKVLLAVGIAGVAGTIVYLLLKKSRPAAPRAKELQASPQPVPALATMTSQPVSIPELRSAATHADMLRLFRQRLADLLGLPVAVANKAAVMRALDAREVSDTVQEKVHGIWQQCEAAVYAPGGLGTEKALHEIKDEAASALDQIRLRLAA